MALSMVITIVLGLLTWFWGKDNKKTTIVAICFGVFLAGTAIGVAIETGLLNAGRTAGEVTANLDDSSAK